jgi:SET domain-containing protein 6
MASTFEKAGSDFWQWLIDNKAAVSDGIAFKDYSAENAGRGVVASRSIKVTFTQDRFPSYCYWSTHIAS